MSVGQLLAQGATEQPRELPMPPEAIGLLALGVLFFLLVLTWAFRGVAAKHPHRDGGMDAHYGAAHGGSHGGGH